MRLFVAIPLPGPVKARLEELKQPIEGMRWTEADQFHLTLRFIGEVEQEVLEKIRHRLSSIDSPPFEMDIKGFGCFPAQKHPRVLWAGVEEASSLMALRQKTEQACREAGLEAEEREFVPHITLAKIKGGRKGDIMSFINRQKAFRIESIPVTEFVLYESRLHKEGAVHTPLERYALNG